MSEERHEVHETIVAEPNHGAPVWVTIAVVIVAIVAVLALGVGYSASSRSSNIEQGLSAQLQPEVNSLRDTVDMLSKRLKQAEESNAQAQGELSVVTDRLKLTQGELARARKQGKAFQEESAKHLEEMESSVRTELASKASSEEVKTLSGDISGVRADVESTSQNLQMAKGELGTLIARNHDEIDQLRRLGQRDYFEFTLDGKGKREKLGSVSVELRATNPKRNQFTIALFSDDLRLEKKNRSINEPIYFYTRGTRAPLELVVNQVGKNKIVGYLSVPKYSAPATGK
jgi:chromosome segregation ATPase